MDNFQTVTSKIRDRLIVLLLLQNLILVVIAVAVAYTTHLSAIYVGIGVIVIGLASALVIASKMATFAELPLKAIWQGIVHLSPTTQGVAAPDLDHLAVGREIVTNLMLQVYQMNDVASHASVSTARQQIDISRNFIAQNLPLPLIVLDATETIKFANVGAATYLGMSAADMVGKNIYMLLDMSFPSEETFDTWLKKVKLENATALSSWERVRLNVRDNHPTRLFDLAAYYNKDNAQSYETMLVLFDHTKQYSQDDQAVSFMALSVHELRTPLTLLRGYIEVFEDEFSDKVDDELKGFMLKMRSQAEQLTAFVNNILNVARVDDDQLELQLQEEIWPTILQSAVENLSLRAKVRGIELKLTVAPNLPTVGVDRISVHEVINNLVDNAIKYSGTGKVIEINSYLATDGQVETTIKDYGLGISTSIIPNLFSKFYRDHRNRAQVGGTGLGLYLSKAIITAHGGNIWVRSKEGEGSTFGFTLIPYTQLAEELKKTGNSELVRGAHGWIKNHSMYRR